MLNSKKLKWKKRLGRVILLFFGVLIGLAMTHFSTKPIQDSSNKAQDSISKKAPTLSQKQVKNFLIAYYTKEDLGENRNRYQDYMTKSEYQSVTNDEDQPAKQAYKGFVVDQVFDKADIYIDNANQQVIANVTYHNSSLKNKNDRSSATTQNKSETLVISYSNDHGDLKVNDLKQKKLSDPDQNEQPQDLNQVRSIHDDNN
ncbi:hypothetical protein PT274_03445 [Leuconostocaceae bacterium ESL0958]|nr:hypothetical protein [Leuconostocaceae bacterium ESL0958]